MTRLHCSAILIYIFAMLPGNVNQTQTVPARATQKSVPFKGTYTTISEPQSPPPMVQVKITGVGQATHLGQGSFVAWSTLNTSTAPPFSIGGTATFNAANGDMFFTTFTGTATPLENGRMHVVMTHDVTGGTGRFMDASGIITGETIAGFSNPEASITYDGYISY